MIFCGDSDYVIGLLPLLSHPSISYVDTPIYPTVVTVTSNTADLFGPLLGLHSVDAFASIYPMVI